jgi:hypothetical protein
MIYQISNIFNYSNDIINIINYSDIVFIINYKNDITIDEEFLKDIRNKCFKVIIIKNNKNIYKIDGKEIIISDNILIKNDLNYDIIFLKKENEECKIIKNKGKIFSFPGDFHKNRTFVKFDLLNMTAEKISLDLKNVITFNENFIDCDVIKNSNCKFIFENNMKNFNDYESFHNIIKKNNIISVEIEFLTNNKIIFNSAFSGNSLIIGESFSGKTTFIKNMTKNFDEYFKCLNICRHQKSKYNLNYIYKKIMMSESINKLKKIKEEILFLIKNNKNKYNNGNNKILKSKLLTISYSMDYFDFFIKKTINELNINSNILLKFINPKGIVKIKFERTKIRIMNRDGIYIKNISDISSSEIIIINIIVMYCIYISEFIIYNRYNVFIIDDCFDLLSYNYSKKIFYKLSEKFDKIIVLGKNKKLRDLFKYSYKIENGLLDILD